MATKSVDTDTFEAEIDSDVPVVVDFWASWCGPCRALAPVLESLSDDYDGKVKVLKVDIMANKALATKYGVTSIPYLGVFKDGELVDSTVGFGGRGKLEALFQKWA